MTPPKSNAEAQAAFKASGRPVSVVLKDPAASEALDALSAKMGSQRAAIEYSLKKCRPKDRK